MFTFSAVPGPRTCFEGVQLLPPGHCLRIVPGRSGGSPVIAERAYWEMDFPAQGEELWGYDSRALINEFEQPSACRRSKSACARMFLLGRISPVASIRA